MHSFHRVILFNPGGEIISSRTAPSVLTRTAADFERMPWLSAVDEAKGKPVLIGAHEDTWSLRSPPEVFSLVRAIQGQGMGYIEVQHTVESVADAISLPKETLEVLVFLHGGELLYTNASDDPADYYAALGGDAIFEADIGGRSELVAVSRSAYGAVVIVAEPMSVIHAGSRYIVSITVGITALFCLISMVFVVLASRILTKPLRELRNVMGQTRLENLGNEVTVTMSNNELEALRISYQNMLERLSEAIIKEKRALILQLQAQFDLLQAQVNPHFLYNVLNVISQRGAENDDEVICELCTSLASMLRYSTNTKLRYATIAEELKYLEQYFYLLKSRYKHKLSYSIDVDASLYGQIIPKIVLQQIAENCVNHGFANAVDDMRVHIAGFIEDKRWVLLVRDNGQGIGEIRLGEINARIAEVKARIARERAQVELEIGGMGVLNTYARLYLKFGDDLDFIIRNRENGVEVLISASITKEGEDSV